VEKIARLFIEGMMDYRTQKKFLLHEFVVMPDHFHPSFPARLDPIPQRLKPISLPALPQA